jgi:hypothetical protein
MGLRFQVTSGQHAATIRQVALVHSLAGYIGPQSCECSPARSIAVLLAERQLGTLLATLQSTWTALPLRAAVACS